MLTWTERGSAQKDTDGPVKAPSAQPVDKTGRCEDPTNCAPAVSHRSGMISDPAINAKDRSTLEAQFALAGRELRVITKPGRSYFEVRRWDECFTVSSVADLHGLLRQFEAALA